MERFMPFSRSLGIRYHVLVRGFHAVEDPSAKRTTFFSLDIFICFLKSSSARNLNTYYSCNIDFKYIYTDRMVFLVIINRI